MAKKSNKNRVKNIITVLIILICIQAAILFVFPKTKGLSSREAMKVAVSKQSNLSYERQEQLKVQWAVTDYMSKNRGKPPKDLNVLVPNYFDSIPLDPTTGKQFAYKVENNMPIVGEITQTAAASVGSGGKKIPGAPAATTVIAASDQAALLEALSDTTEENFVYDPSAKRDPFRPFDFSPKIDEENKTPLERYAIGQLKLTAVLGDADGGTAIVENAAGKGFTIRKGTKIGPNNGVVMEIHQDRLVILETIIDFAGQEKPNKVEMKLRTKDQSNGP